MQNSKLWRRKYIYLILIKYTKYRQYSPGFGHITVEHVRVSLAGPLHDVPPFAGGGLVQERLRF